MKKEELQSLVKNKEMEKILTFINSLPWHHEFEITPGIKTNGSYNPENMFAKLNLPQDMAGLRIADIGASNGYFSFECAKRGADVVAFDFRHENCSGFAIAKTLTRLDIPHHQVNIVIDDLSVYGKFDVVLFLGVLYHIADPIKAIFNILNLIDLNKKDSKILFESFCLDNAIIMPDGSKKTLSELNPSLVDVPLVQYYPHPRTSEKQSLAKDASNYWGFSKVMLELLFKDLGFGISWSQVNNDRILLEAKPATTINASILQDRYNFAYGKLEGSNKEEMGIF